MLAIKSAQIPDFTFSQVRWLHGKLVDDKSYIDSILAKMQQLLEEGRLDITMDELKPIMGTELTALGYDQ